MYRVRILATDRKINRWTAAMRKGALIVASGALIKDCVLGIVLLKHNDRYEASRGHSVTAELLVELFDVE